MVRKRYSHIEAGEQADMVTEALAASDQRVRRLPDTATDSSKDKSNVDH
jgi:hypothetical protein